MRPPMSEDEKKYQRRLTNVKALIIIILVIILTVLLTSCSKVTKFKSYQEVTMYCYSQNNTIIEKCGIEKCIMLNSAEFNDNIKFSAEKNYYQCRLLECGSK